MNKEEILKLIIDIQAKIINLEQQKENIKNTIIYMQSKLDDANIKLQQIEQIKIQQKQQMIETTEVTENDMNKNG